MKPKWVIYFLVSPKVVNPDFSDRCREYTGILCETDMEAFVLLDRGSIENVRHKINVGTGAI